MTRRETGCRCVCVCACVFVFMLGREVYDYKGCGLFAVGGTLMEIKMTGTTGYFGVLLVRGWKMMMYAGKQKLTLQP